MVERGLHKYYRASDRTGWRHNLKVWRHSLAQAEVTATFQTGKVFHSSGILVVLSFVADLTRSVPELALFAPPERGMCLGWASILRFAASASWIALRWQSSYDLLNRIGIERMRSPVAAKMAFPTAGATAMIGVSPPPAGRISLLLTKCTLILGTSENRGTW